MAGPVLRIGTGVLLLCLVSAVPGEEGAPEKAPSAKKTHTIERGPFRVEVELEGVFEAEQMTEVILRPEVWTTLKVETAVEEGTAVKAGDRLLALDTRKLDEEIRDARFNRDLGLLSLKQAESELQSLEKSVPLELESARRAHQIAVEDLEYFLRVDEQQKKRSAEESLKSAQYSLEYAQEELNQLQKMYQADDLTEETEEIILRRAQRDVERSQFYLESAQLRHDRTLQFLLPREKQQLQEAAMRAELNRAKSEATLPGTVERKRIELARLQHTQKQLEEKLAFLQADRELMEVKAPVAGIVYFGEATRGRWTTAANLRKQLRPGGTVSANTVLMTIVQDDRLFVRVDVPEDKYRYFQEGTPAQVKPTPFPSVSYSGQCQALGPVLVKDGTFDGRVSFDPGENSPVPLPGMTCKVLLTPYSRNDAITAPSTAVFQEELDSDRYYVYLDTESGPRKQSVEIGEKYKGRTEILSGLDEGDVILLEKP